MAAASVPKVLENSAPALRHLSDQELHLIRQNPAIAEQQVLGPGRSEGYRQQGHMGFIGRAIILATVATTAGRDDVGPDVPTFAGNRDNVIPSQFAHSKMLAAVHAEVVVAVKQRLVRQRWGPDSTEVASTNGDYGMNVQLRMQAATATDATMRGEKRIPQGPGDITPNIMGRSLLPSFPSHGTATDVKTKHKVHGLSVLHRLREASPQYSMNLGL